MNCPKCGYNMGPLDTTCNRCHGNGLAPQPPRAPVPRSQPNQATRSPSSQGDLFAAVLCIGMIVLCGAMIWHMVSAIWTHDPLVLTDRWGRRPISYTPFSFTWWFFMAVGLAAVGYCSYLLVQILRKQQQS